MAEWIHLRERNAQHAMKTYRIELAGGLFASIVILIVIPLLCFTVIGLPIALAILPTMYQIVEDSDSH